MFVFDIETLSIESSAVILTAAMVYFDDGMSYDEIVEKSIFVKFNAKEQISNYKRTVSKSTLKWWSKQSSIARDLSFNPTPNDVSAIDGIELFRDYLKIDPSPKKIIWARGGLDQMTFESLCNATDTKTIVHYNQWRDVRTAVDLLATTSDDGYCDINHPTFSVQKVLKHHPVHDCAYDAMMLLYPI